jgi:hypothetical protein
MAIGVSLFGATPAAAHDHVVPRAVLVAGNERQTGSVLESTWTERRGDYCLTTSILRVLEFPPAIRSHRGDEVVVRFGKPDEPVDLFVEGWSRVGANGAPRGPGRGLDASLRPVELERSVAWEAAFTPPPTWRHVYLHVFAAWPDREGCGDPDTGSQSVDWLFHLRQRG